MARWRTEPHDEATKREGYSPWIIARRYALVGEVDAAFAWFARAHRERDPSITATRANPDLDPLRSYPRFDDLLRRIGFLKE
jgi:hypothetical protein